MKVRHSRVEYVNYLNLSSMTEDDKRVIRFTDRITRHEKCILECEDQILILENLLKNYKAHIKRCKKLKYRMGLCALLSDACKDVKVLSLSEVTIWFGHLLHSTTRKQTHNYVWKPSDDRARLKWLRQQILSLKYSQNLHTNRLNHFRGRLQAHTDFIKATKHEE